MRKERQWRLRPKRHHFFNWKCWTFIQRIHPGSKLLSLIIVCNMIYLGYQVIRRVVRFSPAKNIVEEIVDSLPRISPVVPDTIPHKEYVRLSDSIRTLRASSDGRSTGGLRTPLIGFSTLTVRIPGSEDREFKEKAILLFGWRLRSSDTRYSLDTTFYYSRGRQSFVRTMSHAKPDKGVMVESPARFRVIGGVIAIPFQDGKLFSVLAVLAAVIGIALLVLWMVLFGEVVKLAFDLYRWRVFTDRNIERFKTLGLLFFAVPIVVLFFHLLMWLIFQQYFIADIELKKELWRDRSWYSVASLFSLLIYRAFAYGAHLEYENEVLRDENELTI